jgi:2-polyprenyl-3-methyl-5-hydroxy-6-metoxy-1,4-benzoquinol methylase
MNKIQETVKGILNKYYKEFPPYSISARYKKTVFEIDTLYRALGELEGKTIIDVGGGWGLYAASCAALGMNATLLDDFGDGGQFNNPNDPKYSMPKDFGVIITKRDVIKDGLGKIPESIDAITCFDMIEHLHASPKGFLHDAMRVLRPGGIILIGVPNCVNLRKRLTVPFGHGSWSEFSIWYEPKVFRDHVREPDVQDLKKIAKDISLNNYSIIGRNWQGYLSPSKVTRISTSISNRVLENFPSLCSDIYLLGFKRKGKEFNEVSHEDADERGSN